MPGLKITRKFSNPNKHPFDEVEWATRHVGLSYAGDVEFPTSWSDTAASITASKYFKIPEGQTQREYSLKQLIRRVVNQIMTWGIAEKYFDTAEDAENFDKELKWLLLHQYLAFNSPVYFNFGIQANPQAAACFILDVDDSIDSMMTFQRNQAMIYKNGSGVGVNLSKIRGKGEPISHGGTSSGSVSFARSFDSTAGMMKSGGVTRRAASMFTLDVDHPDFEEFISIKPEEEEKAKFLIKHGWDSDMEGPVYSRLTMQNANLSVMIDNNFMEAVQQDRDFVSIPRHGGIPKAYKARELLMKMAKAAHACGDPGIQFYNHINDLATCPQAGKIKASNPCGEHLFISSACNLACIKICNDTIDSLAHIARLSIIAQDIICEGASYPTEEIARISKKYRPLGLGITNLGGWLMSERLPYDSQEGRNAAEKVMRRVTEAAEKASAELRDALGTNIEGYLDQDGNQGKELRPRGFGWRNAQLTLALPAGTVSFMLDCDTTGIEPDFSLIRTKKLIGGGVIKSTSSAVVKALKKCPDVDVDGVLKYIQEHNTVIGSSLPPEYYDIFKTASCPDPKGEVSVDGHLLMVKSIQDNIHSGISKTINLPSSTTSEDIYNIFMKAWLLGLKSITVYRQNSKGVQPMDVKEFEEPFQSPPEAKRYPLPKQRKGQIIKFDIGGFEGYLTFGEYPDGYPAETFIQMSKGGSTVNGFAGVCGLLISLGLQYGIPIPVLVEKLKGIQFEPFGFTRDEDCKFVSSPADYVGKKLEVLYLAKDKEKEPEKKVEVRHDDGSPLCRNCGGLQVRAGRCYTCTVCGSTDGGCS